MGPVLRTDPEEVRYPGPEMKLTPGEKARIAIAMRECLEMELRMGNVTLLTSSGGGPWGQAMICGAVVDQGYGMARKWCRTIDELQEFLEEFE